MSQQWQFEMVVQMVRERRLREAAENRLGRQAQAGKGPRAWPIMAWLGRRMVAWGARLQERYDTAAAADAYGMLHPAGETMGDIFCTGVRNR